MARSSCLDPLLQPSRCRLLLCSGAGEQFHASSLWETPKTEEMQSYGTFFSTPCIKIRCRRKSILLPLLAPLCRYDIQENNSFSAEPPAPRCHSPARGPHQLCGRGAAPPRLRPSSDALRSLKPLLCPGIFSWVFIPQARTCSLGHLDPTTTKGPLQQLQPGSEMAPSGWASGTTPKKTSKRPADLCYHHTAV